MNQMEPRAPRGADADMERGLKGLVRVRMTFRTKKVFLASFPDGSQQRRRIVNMHMSETARNKDFMILISININLELLLRRMNAS